MSRDSNMRWRDSSVCRAGWRSAQGLQRLSWLCGHSGLVLVTKSLCELCLFGSMAGDPTGRAEARLVDIDLDTFNIDPVAAGRAVTSKTRAIIVPHLFGLPADLTAFERLGVPLIEDCAQTLGVTESGRPVGTVGRLTVCSFYATKLLCAGEGGMVLSNDCALLDRVRSLREYDGATKLDPSSFNLKLTDLQAALGLSQLGRFESFQERRCVLAATYREALSGKALFMPSVPRGRTHGYYRFTVRIPHFKTDPDGLHGLIRTLEQQGFPAQAGLPATPPVSGSVRFPQQ